MKINLKYLSIFAFVTFFSMFNLIESVYGEWLFKIDAKYGSFIGKGEADNEFQMTPGIILSLRKIQGTGKLAGASWSIGYQKLENTLENEKYSVDGDLFTLSQLDLYFPVFSLKGLYWSLGVGWDMTKFETTSDYDHMYTIPVGLLYRLELFKDWKMDFSCKGKYIFDNSLEQDLGVDFTISLPFK